MIKKVLLEIIDYLRYQIVNDKCTPEEMKSIYSAMAENLDMDATAKDIADFYGKSEFCVRNLTQRTFVHKPKRKVYYNFAEVVKYKPKSWKHNTDSSGCN